VARILGVSQRKVQKMAVRGEIPAARVGGVWTFDLAKVRAWIAAAEQVHYEAAARYDANVMAAARAFREQRRRDAMSRLPAPSIDEAYERAIGLKPRAPRLPGGAAGVLRVPASVPKGKG
jgi:excisionase family DNA binding protein